MEEEDEEARGLLSRGPDRAGSDAPAAPGALPALCDPSRLAHRLLVLLLMCFLGFGERPGRPGGRAVVGPTPRLALGARDQPTAGPPGLRGFLPLREPVPARGAPRRGRGRAGESCPSCSWAPGSPEAGSPRGHRPGGCPGRQVPLLALCSESLHCAPSFPAPLSARNIPLF